LGSPSGQNGTELGAPGDEYNKSPWREGSPRLLKTKLERSRTPLPSCQGDLLYSSPGVPGGHLVIPTASGRHLSRLTYKFYGACWLRVASWRYFSNLFPRVLSLPRESTLVAAGHISMYTNEIPIWGGSLT